jgi:hypothetical protein
MKFNILKAVITYGGGTSGPDFYVAVKDVSADYVQGYFKNIPIHEFSNGEFSTEPDSMGCNVIYKIIVVNLC